MTVLRDRDGRSFERSMSDWGILGTGDGLLVTGVELHANVDMFVHRYGLRTPERGGQAKGVDATHLAVDRHHR